LLWFIKGNLLAANKGVLPVGTVMQYVSSNAPSGWLLCNGSAISTNVYSNLFAVIGITYGGSSTNFNVPDIRGRIVIGKGTGSGLTARNLNDQSGSETIALTNIPGHVHGVSPPTGTSGDESARHSHIGASLGAGTVYKSGATWNGGGGAANSQNTSHTHLVDFPAFNSGSSGGGAAFAIMPPFRVVNYIIKY